MKLKKTTAAPLLVLAVMLLLRLPDVFSLYNAVGENLYITVIVLQLAVIALPAILYSRIRGGEFTASLRLSPCSLPSLIFAVTAALGMIFCNLLINFLRVRLGGSFSPYTFYHLDLPLSDGAGENMAALLAFALIPALCEELLFRGIVLKEYESKGVFIAVFFSSVLFAVSHDALEKLPEYLICGGVLALTVYVTGSLFASALAHFLYNLFCLFGLSPLNAIITHIQSLDLLIFLCAVLLLLSVFFALSLAEGRFRAKARADKKPDFLDPAALTEKPMMRFFTALSSPPMLGCLLLYIVAVCHIF